MDINNSKRLMQEFFNMDPNVKSQISNGFIQSIIEPFLGKKEEFNKILQQEKENILINI